MFPKIDDQEAWNAQVVRVCEVYREVIGSDANEKITIRPKSSDPSLLKVRMKPQGRTAVVHEIDAALVTSIHVMGCAGNDMIAIGHAITHATLLEGGDDLLFGGPGDDQLTGGTGLDLIFDCWHWVCKDR